LKAKKKDISDAAHDGPKSGESWEKKSASSPERIPSSLAPVMTPPWFLGSQQQKPSLILFLSFLMSPRIAKWRLWSVRRNHLTSSTSIRLIVFQQRRYIATGHFFFFRHTHTVTGNSKRFTHATAIASRLIFIYKFDKLQLFYELIF
jgi:hypothetical protein